MKKASAEVEFVSLAAGASFETEAKSDASMLFLVKPKERLIRGREGRRSIPGCSLGQTVEGASRGL